MEKEMIEEKSENSQEQEAISELPPANTAALLEALLITNGEALDFETINFVTGFSEDQINQAVAELQNRYAEVSCGIEIRRVASKLQIRTKSDLAGYIQKLKSGRPRRLSPAALETLAIVAYRQPVVKSDIDKIRGVDVTPTIKTLLDRNLIKIIGHQATVGQPALYATTDEFLKVFGINSLEDLPSLKELDEIESHPGEESSGAIPTDSSDIEAEVEQPLNSDDSEQTQN